MEGRNGERVRPARVVSRLAKHTFALYATFCASTRLRTEGKCGARRTAPRPGRSRSQIIPMLRAVILSQSESNQFGERLKAKALKINNLQNKQLRSGQTDVKLS